MRGYAQVDSSDFLLALARTCRWLHLYRRAGYASTRLPLSSRQCGIGFRCSRISANLFEILFAARWHISVQNLQILTRHELFSPFLILNIIFERTWPHVSTRVVLPCWYHVASIKVLNQDGNKIRPHVVHRFFSDALSFDVNENPWPCSVNAFIRVKVIQVIKKTEMYCRYAQLRPLCPQVEQQLFDTSTQKNM